MKRSSSFVNLQKCFNEDFKQNDTNKYEELKRQLIYKINNCGRSIEDQYLETTIKIAELNTGDYLAEIALAFSVFASIVSILLEMEHVWFTIILGGLAIAFAFIALSNEKKIRRYRAYYNFKLICIECASKTTHKDYRIM